LKALTDVMDEHTIVDIKCTNHIDKYMVEQVLSYHYLSQYRDDLHINRVIVYDAISGKHIEIHLPESSYLNAQYLTLSQYQALKSAMLQNTHAPMATYGTHAYVDEDVANIILRIPRYREAFLKYITCGITWDSILGCWNQDIVNKYDFPNKYSKPADMIVDFIERPSKMPSPIIKNMQCFLQYWQMHTEQMMFFDSETLTPSQIDLLAIIGKAQKCKNVSDDFRNHPEKYIATIKELYHSIFWDNSCQKLLRVETPTCFSPNNIVESTYWVM
ncbi:MAG: hypothetical protein II453_09610, partial [Alphaproteobacteria bacterium]|nr:hypothetical protein [Alphaproteobacteria bacterium]